MGKKIFGSEIFLDQKILGSKKMLVGHFFGPNSIFYDLSVLSCSSLLTADLNNNNTEREREREIY